MPGQGGLLYVAPEPPDSFQDIDFFCRQLVRECTTRGYRGSVVDLPQDTPAFRDVAGRMEQAMHAARMELYLPESYSEAAPASKLLVSTAISSGSLKQRLSDAVRRYGAARVIPAVEKVAVDFPSASRSSSGTRLTPQELEALRLRVRADIYWSPELCARYFTYSEAGTQTHFVLFDDAETVRAKLRIMRDLQLAECMIAWNDWI
jgi:hypothetical protein